MTETHASDMIAAAADLVGRTGAKTFQIRFADDESPVVWIAVAGFPGGIHEVGAALNPEKAALRLLEVLVDGGTCQHCGQPTGVSDDHRSTPPITQVCWYEYDPELRSYRRGCE